MSAADDIRDGVQELEAQIEDLLSRLRMIVERAWDRDLAPEQRLKGIDGIATMALSDHAPNQCPRCGEGMVFLGSGEVACEAGCDGIVRVGDVVRRPLRGTEKFSVSVAMSRSFSCQNCSRQITESESVWGWCQECAAAHPEKFEWRDVGGSLGRVGRAEES